MEKINISELLRDCPQGMELDCTLWDNVTFDRVADGGIWIKHIDSKSGERSLYVYNDGSFPIHNLGSFRTKCVIFPKGKTTWEGFQRPFKDGDIVAFDNPHRDNLQLFIFKNKKENSTLSSCYLMLDGDELDLEEGMYYITRLATEEEKQKLFDAIKENGYKWNAETKTLEKLVEPKFKVGDRVKHISTYATGVVLKVADEGYYIDLPKNGGVRYISFTLEKDYEVVPNKFDIATLKPFDKVLVRNTNKDYWKISMFGYISKGDNQYFMCTANSGFYQCVPYESNQHLLGTTNDCDDFYKTWEK